MTNTTAPAFTHTDDCTDGAIGRTVRQMRTAMIHSVPERVDTLELLSFLIDASQVEQNVSRCGCGRLALTRVENDLRLARKRERSFRDSPAFGSLQYGMIAREVETLIARRTAIREAIA